MAKLRFKITYLKWNGKRKTVKVKAHSLPSAIEKVKKKANEDVITWYSLIDAKRIKK